MGNSSFNCLYESTGRERQEIIVMLTGSEEKPDAWEHCIRSKDEGKRMKCGRCGTYSHNRSMCKETP